MLVKYTRKMMVKLTRGGSEHLLSLCIMQKKTELVKERESLTIYSIKMTAIKKAERQKMFLFCSNCVLIRVKQSLRSLVPKTF